MNPISSKEYQRIRCMKLKNIKKHEFDYEFSTGKQTELRNQEEFGCL